MLRVKKNALYILFHRIITNFYLVVYYVLFETISHLCNRGVLSHTEAFNNN